MPGAAWIACSGEEYHPITMRTHPVLRSSIFGLVLGIVVGVAFYAGLRLFGYDVNRYLLVAIVVFCIPGYVLLSMLLEEDELDDLDWHAERDRYAEEARKPPPSP
jgi:hypothetical protein